MTTWRKTEEPTVDTRLMFGEDWLARERHPLSARFHEILEELGELHDLKQLDYGTPEDPFANVRRSSAWGVPAWVGAMLRLDDKVGRLQSLIRNGRLFNESAEESLVDIAVYSVIALVLLEEDRRAGRLVPAHERDVEP